MVIVNFNPTMNIEAEKNRYHGDVGWASDNELFSEVAVTWRQWIGNAGEHIYTSQLLLPEISAQEERINELARKKKSARIPPMITSIYFFHCALAVENSFKSVIASKHAEEIKNEISIKEKMPRNILGHDLVGLASRAGYDLCINNEYALAFLTRYGVWGGKYPLPINNTDYALTIKLSDGNFYMVGGYNPKVVPSFLRFAEEIYTWAREKCEIYSR